MDKLLHIVLIVTTLLSQSYSEYIPPGPAFPCPKEADLPLLFPCTCEKGTDKGIFVRCENTGLAAISVGIGNIAGLGLPVEQLWLKECKISNLFGPLLHRSQIRTLYIEDSPIREINEYAFAGVNRTLQELHLINTKLTEFPKDAFKILGNISTIRIDGHEITKLGKDIFAGSEANGKLERLHLVNGLISDIAPEAFQYLKKLKKLDLHGNKLGTLKKNQFKGLRDTEVLDLSHNNIPKLDGSHIGDMTKLGWCNISHNNIAEIPRGMFARNTVLKVLHLNNNKLKKLDINSFRGMRFLIRLFLQDNEIAEVGRGTFTSVTRIGTINLARNRINKVDFQMFQTVKYAEVIDLAENNITIIENQAFTDLYLATVNISHNQLSKIEKNSFVNCNNITLLDLSHNQLENIERDAFDFNTYASELQVSYNKFTDLGQIPIQNMTGIRVLNASHNSIERIPRNAFPKLYELHTVDISYNNLSDIYNAIFQNLFSIRFLNLSHNSMEQIKSSTFGTVPTILELDLSHNKLRDVSRGSLAQLASCRVLDISFNHLTKIFQIPISLGELNIAHNELTEIKSNTWPTMNALLRLNLSANMLDDSLNVDSFSGLLTLQSLDLSSNRLTKPPWEALNRLSSLQYLYMQYNNLTELSKSAFGNLPTIFKLDLSYNQLSSIGQSSFFGLQQLLDLSLRGNKLDHIPNEAFKSLVALRKLDLSYNNLEKIDNKTNGLLDDCLSIEMVNLSHNNIGFLTKKMFPSNPWIPYKLYEVDLSYNSLPVITMDITHGTKKLKKLNVAHNHINDLRTFVLGNLTSLEVLDISHNDLKDLVSKSSFDLRFDLPDNITEMYLNNNDLTSLPVNKLVKAKKLRLLDVRDNQLTRFEPGLVNKVEKEGLQVLYQGNDLICDCKVRPLKHYLNHMSATQMSQDDKYKDLTCSYPESVQNQTLAEVDEERMICQQVEKEISENKFELVAEPDLAFRDVQYSQTSIYVHWFVISNEDVADFFVFIRDDKNKLFYKNDVSYNLRSLTIAVDDLLKAELQKGSVVEICIQAKTGLHALRKWFPNQCQKVDPDFSSWPKKLNVDKRRLTKKKVRYSWFSNSVLTLVSDSILITLCIFLSVCFRRLADFDL